MSIFRLKGTITAIGAGTMTEGGTKHDWIEITPDGGRVYGVTRVWVGANAARGVCPGVRGEFFFDRVFVLGAPTRIWKQLYGIRSMADRLCTIELHCALPLSHFTSS